MKNIVLFTFILLLSYAQVIADIHHTDTTVKGNLAVTGTVDGVDVSALNDKVGTLTDTKWCVGTATGFQCTTDAPVTSESDPQVGTLTNGKLCTTDGTDIDCATDKPSGAILGTTDAQAISAKDIDGGTASDTSRITIPKNTTTNLDGLTRKEGTLVYDTTAGALKVDNGASLVTVGSGGQGGINYVTAYDAEDSSGGTTGWVTYDDGATATPVDGTGGTVGATWEASATSPLRGSKSFLFTSNAQGEGVSYDFTLHSADTNKPIYVSFDYSCATYTSNDLVFYMYDGTSATALTGSAANGRGTFIYYNDTDTSLRFIIHQATANSFTCKFDNIKIGPDKLIDGPVIQYLGALTTTGTWIANTTYTGYYWRVNDILKAEVTIEVSGAPTSATLRVTLPSSLTIDTTTKITNTTNLPPLGSAVILDSGTALIAGAVYYNSTTAVEVVYYNDYQDNTNPVVFSGVTQAAPITFASGDKITIRYEVPILEWANQTALLSTTAMMNSISKVSAYRATDQTGINPNNSAVKLNIDTIETSSGDGAFSTTGYKYTAPATDWYSVNSGVLIAGTNVVAGAVYTLRFYVDGALKSVGQTHVGVVSAAFRLKHDDRIYLTKGQYIELYIATDANHSVNTLTMTGGATASWLRVERKPDFSVYGVYGQTELISSANGGLSTYSITAGQWGDLTSISLTPGEWDIFSQATYFNNSGSALSASQNAQLGISTTSGNSSTGLLEGTNYLLGWLASNGYASTSVTIARYNITITSTTTYYLKSRLSSDITNMQVGYSISARRIK